MRNKAIEPGLYKHFKGGVYEVLFTAENAATGGLMVVYKKQGNESERFVRPAFAWFDQVGVDEAGQPITRFTRCL